MMRVGLDTSPLVLTKAGTARYLTRLIEGLEQEPSVEVSPLSWGADGRGTKVARDMFWYPRGLGRAAKRAEVDLLHCPTMRGPLRSKIPLAVTIHDVAVLRHPEAFNTWTRRYSATTLPEGREGRGRDRRRLPLLARRAARHAAGPGVERAGDPVRRRPALRP